MCAALFKVFVFFVHVSCSCRCFKKIEYALYNGTDYGTSFDTWLINLIRINSHKSSSEVTQDQTSPAKERGAATFVSANLRESSTRELLLPLLLLMLFTRPALTLVYSSSRELSLPLSLLMLCPLLAIALVYFPRKLPLPLLLLVLVTLLALAPVLLLFALRSLSLLTFSEQVELLKLGADLAWRQLRPNPLFHTGWHASCILVRVSCASKGCPQWMPSLVRDSPLADR